MNFISCNIEDKCENDIVYENFKQGDFIRVVHMNNSAANCYKGYIGEIRAYRKGQDHALISLNALNSSVYIKMPLEHFVKMNP